MMEEYLKKHSNIRYYYHGGPLGGRGIENWKFVMKQARGEYVNMLLHDDIFHAGKISRMMDCFIFDDHHELAVVASRQGRIDENGKPLSRQPFYWVSFKDQRISSEEAAQRILCFGQNFVGGMASAIYRLSDLPDDYVTGNKTANVFSGVTDRGLGDMATWLELFQKGQCLFIPDVLSSIRNHPEQNGRDETVETYCVLDRFSYVALCWLNGIYLKTDALIRRALDMILVDSHAMLGDVTYRTEDKDFDKDKKQLESLLELVEQKEYQKVLSKTLDYILERESGVDKTRTKALCIRDDNSGLWMRKI